MVLDKKFGAPLITNDGVTIAKEIELEDPFENMGAQLVKRSCHQDQRCGRRRHHHRHRCWLRHLVREGMKNVTAGANPMVIKQAASRRPLHAAVEAIKSNCQKVITAPRTSPVSAPFPAGDESIGKLIAEAMEKVTADGVITVEESKTMLRPTCEVVEGMQFDRGYVTPYMVTDTEKMEAVCDDALRPDHR